MAMEIERRFLVSGDGWRTAPGRVLKQGFIAVSRERVVRVRIDGDTAWLTIKAMITHTSRHEFEYAIPMADAQTMLDTLCPAVMEKLRRRVTVGSHVWEVDEFFGANSGLVLIEVELISAEQTVIKPDWVGEDVSGDSRYSNAMLSFQPYTTWRNG